MWGMMAKIYLEEGGVRALYKGIVPTAVGVAPYVVRALLCQLVAVRGYVSDFAHIRYYVGHKLCCI